MFEVFIILHYVYHERSGFSKTSQENMYTLNKIDVLMTSLIL